MTEEDFRKNKEQLDMLMCQGRYNEAKVLCDLLISATDNCEGNALLEPHKNIRLELAQIYASIVIETPDKTFSSRLFEYE